MLQELKEMENKINMNVHILTIHTRWLDIT
jgi:hypothetical protein